MCERRRTADPDMQHRGIVATKESYQRLLESLHFPDIHAREEGIDEAHKQTFEWIFDEPGKEVTPWHHLVSWLEEGHGTYWISGKAGSGKSTLMNFICHDPRTESALKIWSGPHEVFMPNFFFWSPGSPLQKSLVGLLRSLIYQILEKFPDLMTILAKSTGFSQHDFGQFPTWTEQRLRATLQDLLSVGLGQCRLCVFIDGLDEFHGDHFTLLELISSFRENTKVKFCLSSRPYSPFKRELGSSPMLRLQDLTEPDIRRYVSDKLERTPLKASWVSYSSSIIKEPVDAIIRKAEGVFLWVRLAVKDQLEGIKNGDDAEQLRERLHILPTEIEDVYVHMLHGIHKVYRKEVARYIQWVLDMEDARALFEIALAEHKRIDDIVLFSQKISTWDICQHCKSVGERIAATCKGFLEVREMKESEDWEADRFSQLLKIRNIPLEQHEELRELRFLDERTRVEFLHRTAFDFFKENEQGKEFLKTHTIANSHPQLLYTKVLLAKLVIFPVPTNNELVQVSIESIMFNASLVEAAIGVAQLALMHLINRSITLLWEHVPGQPSSLHWCKVWGKTWYGEFWSKRFRILLSAKQPVDFLGLAARYGLDKYVQHMLDSRSGKWESGYVEYLLSCSVDGLGHTLQYGSFPSNLELIAALLKRGADPNMQLLESTVWGPFLRFLDQNLQFRRYRLSFPEESWRTNWRTNWRNTAKAFLESGANVHENICTLIERRGSLKDVTSVELRGYVIELHRSPRSVLQQCFAEDPEYLEIEDALIASGATLYLKCTRLVVEAAKVWVVKDVDLKPSEQQLNQLTNICEQDGLESEKLDCQVIEIIGKRDFEQLFEQAPTGTELGQEDQSDTHSDSTTEPSSTDAPASPTDEAEGSFHSAQSSQQGED